jgi:hypothetical protein
MRRPPRLFGRTRALGAAVLALSAGAGACGGAEPPPLAGTATPIYNEATGALEQLVSDTNQDGRIDTRAHMDGVRLKHIEVDRDFDGRFDRWEYYRAAPGTPAAARSPDGRSVLDHAEEANGSDDRITRREFYADGVVSRVEEDTDLDGRIDKWEAYTAGVLTRMDLDVEGRGRPGRRLVYGPRGDVERVEIDADGDGVFEPLARAGQEGSR